MREIGYEDDDESDDSDTYENTGAQDTEKTPEEPVFSAEEFVKEKTVTDTAPKAEKRKLIQRWICLKVLTRHPHLYVN